MKRTRCWAHQVQSLRLSSTLVRQTWSPSVAMVPLMAPMWNTISSAGLVASQASSSAGGTICAGGWRAMLRHLPCDPSRSAITVCMPRCASSPCR